MNCNNETAPASACPFQHTMCAGRTSAYTEKSGAIAWKVELRFHRTRADAVKSGDPKVLQVECKMAESNSLAAQLGKHLDVRAGNSATRSRPVKKINRGFERFAAAVRETSAFFVLQSGVLSAGPKGDFVGLFEKKDGHQISYD